jgi:DNA replication and repair protein RecF
VRLLRLQLENFRNYRKADISFDPHTTIVAGSNAMGKSNLIEAIGLLSTTHSTRAMRERDVVQHDSTYGVARAWFERDSRQYELTVLIESDGSHTSKRWKLQGAATSSSKVAGKLLTVSFAPEDVDTLVHSSQARREYLDSTLSQTQPEFTSLTRRYRSVLKQRASALESIRDGHSVDISGYDAQLITLGAEITQTRLLLIQKLTPLIDRNSDQLSPQDQLSVRLSNPVYQLSEIQTRQDIEKVLAQALEDLAQAERATGRCLVGPQRDDLEISLTKRSLRQFGSRGQWRSCVLSLKLAEAQYLQQTTGEQPVLLLDDIFSEFDSSRRTLLLNWITSHQAILTSAVPQELGPIAKKSKLVRVHQGTIQESHNKKASDALVA